MDHIEADKAYSVTQISLKVKELKGNSIFLKPIFVDTE